MKWFMNLALFGIKVECALRVGGHIMHIASFLTRAWWSQQQQCELSTKIRYIFRYSAVFLHWISAYQILSINFKYLCDGYTRKN